MSTDDNGSGIPTSFEELVELTLSNLPPRVATAVRLSAIPQHFERDLFAALLATVPGEGLPVEPILDYLQRIAFLRQYTEGRFYYRPDVRSHLLEWWREQEASYFQAANDVILGYYRAQLPAADAVRRRLLEGEILYHLFLADEAAGLAYLQRQFEEATSRYQLGQAVELVSRARQLEEQLSATTREWLAYYGLRLQWLQERRSGAEDGLLALSGKTQDRLLGAVARWTAGEALLGQQDWSGAIGEFQQSLEGLLRLQASDYAARVMLSLGNAYRDLAESSGGLLLAEEEEPASGVERFTRGLQHLPFLLYERLLRRLSFLPAWYYGTNYQHWVIAYLLVEANGWYARAEQTFGEAGARIGQVRADIARAELEHQLGRWSLARARYEQLLQSPEVQESPYRRARVRLGQGRTWVEEGELDEARPALLEALAVFSQLEDRLSTATAARWLGYALERLGEPNEAVAPTLLASQLFGAAGAPLRQTQAIWALEGLAVQPALSADNKQAIARELAATPRRRHITRLPDSLLGLFRNAAIWGALPLTYLVALLLSLFLSLSLAIVESIFVLPLVSQSPLALLTELLTLLAGAVLPVLLAIWSYRLIYSLMGTALVRFLGRRLLRIQEDQPCFVETDEEGIRQFRPDDEEGEGQGAMAWGDVSRSGVVEVALRRRPIGLISSLVVAAAAGPPLRISALTSGYRRLKQEITARAPAPPQDLRFALLSAPWLGLIALLSLAVALFAFLSGSVSFTAVPLQPGEEAPLFSLTSAQTGTAGTFLPLSSLVIVLAPTLILFAAAVALWRLVAHRHRIERRLQAAQEAPPTWSLWAVAILATVIALAWTLFWLALGAGAAS